MSLNEGMPIWQPIKRRSSINISSIHHYLSDHSFWWSLDVTYLKHILLVCNCLRNEQAEHVATRELIDLHSVRKWKLSHKERREWRLKETPSQASYHCWEKEPSLFTRKRYREFPLIPPWYPHPPLNHKYHFLNRFGFSIFQFIILYLFCTLRRT